MKNKRNQTMYNKVRNYRVVMGYTQQEMAEKLGINLLTYRNIENMYKLPSYRVRRKLCDIFNVSLDQLFYIE